MEEKLELRMYGMVNYQLTGIQKGIQFGHSVTEYGQFAKNILTKHESLRYDDWADNYKTVIVLNGGSTNLSVENPGTLNQHLLKLSENDIFCAPFYETDLGDQLTAISFIVDERVFNKAKYPEFKAWLNEYHLEDLAIENIEAFSILSKSNTKVIGYFKDSKNIKESSYYTNWLELIGGDKNLFLREFLYNFDLANG